MTSRNEAGRKDGLSSARFRVYDSSMVRRFPSDLTSYDLLKTWAVVAMIIDHTGYYFYPEDDWFRAIGRLCVPVFFFLIGYANSRDLGPKMWIGTGILLAANVVTGLYVFPLNILATMLFLRIVIDRVMQATLSDYEKFTGFLLIVVFLTLPSEAAWEYGTMGLPIAMYGWLRRHPDRTGFLNPLGVALVGVFAMGFYAFAESVLFGLDRAQTLFVALGSFGLFGVMAAFRPVTFPRLSGVLPAPASGAVRLMGRYSLEIYVVHLVIFKFAALLMGDERFGWFDVSLMP